MADRGLTGVLLVGGQSRRFGSPKALTRLRGSTLAEIAWETLGEACDERLAVGKDADGLELPFAIIDDGTTIRSPLAGVVAGVRAASHERVVVLPVDMPLVTVDVLRTLAHTGAEAAIPQTGPAPEARLAAPRDNSRPPRRHARPHARWMCDGDLTAAHAGQEDR